MCLARLSKSLPNLSPQTGEPIKTVVVNKEPITGLLATREFLKRIVRAPVRYLGKPYTADYKLVNLSNHDQPRHLVQIRLVMEIFPVVDIFVYRYTQRQGRTLSSCQSLALS